MILSSWSCLHQWLEAQHQNPTCPVCKAGCAQDKVIPIYGRGKEQLDPRYESDAIGSIKAHPHSD